MKVQEIRWSSAELLNNTSGTASMPCASNCADIIFINTSTTATYLIDGMPVPPLSVWVDGCNQGEYNTHTYSIQGPAPALVGGYLQGLYVRRKLYGKLIEI